MSIIGIIFYIVSYLSFVFLIVHIIMESRTNQKRYLEMVDKYYKDTGEHLRIISGLVERNTELRNIIETPEKE